MKGMSHETDEKILTTIYITRPNLGTRLVFKFLRGSDDLKYNNFIYCGLMPVSIGLIMLAVYFRHSC